MKFKYRSVTEIRAVLFEMLYLATLPEGAARMFVEQHPWAQKFFLDCEFRALVKAGAEIVIKEETEDVLRIKQQWDIRPLVRCVIVSYDHMVEHMIIFEVQQDAHLEPIYA